MEDVDGSVNGDGTRAEVGKMENGKQAQQAEVGKMEEKPSSPLENLAAAQQSSIVPFHKLFAFADAVDFAYIFVGTVAAAAHGLALPIFLLIFGKMLNSFGTLMNNPQEMYHQVSKYALYFVYVAIVTLVSSWAEVSCWMQAGERQVSRLRIKYLQAMLKQDIAYFDLEARTGDIVDSISTNMLVIQEAISEKMGSFIHYMGTFVGGFVVGFATVWQLGLVTLAVLPVIAVMGGFYTKAVTGIASKSQTAYSTPGNIAEEVTAQIRTVYSFVGETRAVAAYSNALQTTLKLGFKGGAAKGFGVGGMYGLMLCTWALLLWYGGVLIRKGTGTGGEVLSTIFAVLLGGIAVGQASPSIGIFAKARAAATTILKTINHEPTINNDKGDGIELSDVEGRVELRNVDFCYPSRPDVKVFHDFSLIIPAGKSVAIVGGSGSGKSTVVSLIERFYDPSSGSVLVDGHDIRSLKLKWLRSQLGLVNQEPALFATTIRNNILYGKPAASTEEIEAAAKAANAHTFISQLPDGYDTQVGERGVQLSGGQKQRVAIARAIIKNPSILLFDEATSALDAESEHIVQDALDKLMLGHTTVVVAHRLSTIQDADSIAVVQAGKIVELGTHEQLLSNETGVYAALVHIQNMAKQVTRDERPSRKSLSKSISRRSPSSGRISFSRIKSFISRQSSTKSENLEVEESDEVTEVPKSKRYFFRLFKLNASEWPFLLLGSVAAALAGVVNPIFAFVISNVLKVYFNPDRSYMKSEVRKYAILFACMGGGVFLVISILHYSFGRSGESLTKRVREMMFAAITTFEIGWFDRPENGSSQIASKLSTNAAYVRAAMGDRILIILQNSSLLISAFTIAIVVEWRVALVVTATFPLLILSGMSEQMFLKGFAGNIEKAHERATNLAGEAVSNIRTVAAFNAEAKMVDLVAEELEIPRRSSFVRGQIAGVGYGLGSCFLFTGFALGLWYTGLLIRDGKASFGNAFKSFLVLVVTSTGIAETLALSPDIVKGGQALRSVFAILDRRSEIPPEDPSAEAVASIKGEIELKDVGFSYPTRPEVAIFKSLNLRVRSGQSLALVGSSGSGKSSVIALVQRFYDPIAGKVMVDGRDIRLYQLRSYRRFVGLVQQEPALFATSIEENIRYGREDASESEIVAAATAANAHGFISALPDGYNTSVGERGTQLSGGQKQRVAIARAVLKNPSILLLDEATSALDAESERIVQEALDRLMQGRSTIVVAHRLSTIRNADKIAVIQDGTIVEQGSHWDLVANPDGAYSHLIKLQQQHGSDLPDPT